MIPQSSIFYHLTAENENAVTFLFANLLQTKYIRDLCLEYLLQKNDGDICPFEYDKEKIDALNQNNIQTQFHDTETNIQPDIKIENDCCLILIEDKIRWGVNLQESQITWYPEYIRQHGNNKRHAIIFLIPNQYSREKELNEAGKKFKDIPILIRYWEDFLSFLYSKQLDRYSPVIAEALSYIKKTVDSTFVVDTKFTPYEAAMIYTPKEMKATLDVLSKFKTLISNTDKQLIDNLNLNTSSKLFESSGWESYVTYVGTYIKYKGHDVLYHGFSFYLVDNSDSDNSKNPADFVFSVAFSHQGIIDDYSEKLVDKEYYDDGKWLYFRLPKESIFSDNQENMYIKEVSKIILTFFIPIAK